MVSVVVLTKNEACYIERCLRHLTWCDEIIVIDDFSTDKTVAIAKKFGAKIFKRRLNGNFSDQRNFGIKKAKGEWILFIDADEEVTGELSLEIKAKILKKDIRGFLINRKDVFLGKKMKGGEWGSAWLLRLGRKNSGQWARAVHESWRIEGNVVKLTSPLLHSAHPDLFSFIQKINVYAKLHAKSNFLEVKRSNLLKIIFIPPAKFIYNFVLKRGYKDGVHGVVYATLMSFHSFLSWWHLWQLQQERKH